MPLLKLGAIVATPNCLEFCRDNNIDVGTLLKRHSNCDWGDLDHEDIKANNDSLLYDGRILSSYNFNNGKVWIITEWDRSVTTILLPSDY